MTEANTIFLEVYRRNSLKVIFDSRNSIEVKVKLFCRGIMSIINEPFPPIITSPWYFRRTIKQLYWTKPIQDVRTSNNKLATRKFKS